MCRNPYTSAVSDVVSGTVPNHEKPLTKANPNNPHKPGAVSRMANAAARVR